MFVVCVTVCVLPDRADDFISAARANAAATRREPKNVRFDVLRAADDASRFFLYEVYLDEEGFREHQQTPHYLAWKAEVAPLMAATRIGVKYVSLFPDPWS